MIKSISLKNFRLFDEYKINTASSLVILSGKNATGKTSILEAIYLLSTAKSHRTNDLSNLLKHDADFFVSEITAKSRLKFVFSNQGKHLFINNLEIKKISNFVGNLPVVMFSPNDLELINGAKSDRRHFLDLQISLIDKNYLIHSSNYKKLLAKRNELLKEKEINTVLLDIITKELIDNLRFIYQKRIEFINELNYYLVDIAKSLSIDAISLKYLKSYDDDIEKSFKNKLKLDSITGTTNIGTHRDDFLIELANKEAKAYASEGQRRAICIAIKLALKEIIAKYQEEPILLLDDVFASLDKIRISSLVEYVKKSKQTFITTTSTLEVPDTLLRNALVLRIDKKGEL